MSALKSFAVSVGRSLSVRQYSSSTMVGAKKFMNVSRFSGEPKLTDFKLEEEQLPALKDGGE